ncbi:hypothetical protein DTL42_13050 [Bremerella cremea]|uniref:HisA/hisF family protein n=1 Tax=Bremerella cremea TaxID=1031537 RepID=A0A368KV01_9BACT|nr:HisA/HisF-related TIM barrel protein [Bremerella cremea]RCS49447.1 hypothetical protein DTL42_13050 [Bremerella cremea]
MSSPSDRPAWYDAILPVMDLRLGQVVRGVAGRRDEYLPVQSRYVDDSRPGTIAMLLAQTFGFRDCYVADLNAIAGGQVDAATLEAIAVQGLNVWLDAGVGSVARWQACSENLRGWSPFRWIVGLESLVSWQAMRQLVEAIEPERLVFSLDLKQGKPLTNRPELVGLSALEIAKTVAGMGVGTLLVLDVEAVGEGTGARTEDLLDEISREVPEIELVAGGGMASPAGIESLMGHQVRRVLVASALHDGRIAPYHGGGRGAGWE